MKLMDALEFLGIIMAVAAGGYALGRIDGYAAGWRERTWKYARQEKQKRGVAVEGGG